MKCCGKSPIFDCCPWSSKWCTSGCPLIYCCLDLVTPVFTISIQFQKGNWWWPCTRVSITSQDMHHMVAYFQFTQFYFGMIYNKVALTMTNWTKYTLFHPYEQQSKMEEPHLFDKISLKQFQCEPLSFL